MSEVHSDEDSEVFAMDKRGANWVGSQQKTYSTWVAYQLKLTQPIIDLVAFFQNGTNLIKLLHHLYPLLPVPKYIEQPTNRIHEIDNVTSAVSMLEQAGVKAPFLKPTNGDETMIMGLIWILIDEVSIKTSIKQERATLRTKKRAQYVDSGDIVVTIDALPTPNASSTQQTSAFDDLSVEEEAKQLESFDFQRESLLSWCRTQTKSYGVPITDLTSSFLDGKAFAALIHSISPNNFDYAKMIQNDRLTILQNCFRIALQDMNIIPLLDESDFAASPPRVDEKSIMAYVSQLMKYYTSEEKLIRDLDSQFQQATLQSTHTPIYQAMTASCYPPDKQPDPFLQTAEVTKPNSVPKESPYMPLFPLSSSEPTAAATPQQQVQQPSQPQYPSMQQSYQQPPQPQQSRQVYPPPQRTSSMGQLQPVQNYQPQPMYYPQPYMMPQTQVMYMQPPENDMQKVITVDDRGNIMSVSYVSKRSNNFAARITAQAAMSPVAQPIQTKPKKEKKEKKDKKNKKQSQKYEVMRESETSPQQSPQQAHTTPPTSTSTYPSQQLYPGVAQQTYPGVISPYTIGNTYGSSSQTLYPGSCAPIHPPGATTSQPQIMYIAPSVQPMPQLPPGWECRFDPQNRPFYVDHNTKTTTYIHPFQARQQPMVAPQPMMQPNPAVSQAPMLPLPPGWDRKVDSTGRVFYVDHNTKTTTFTHPAEANGGNARGSLQK